MADGEPHGSPFAGTRIADLAELEAKLAEIAASPQGPAAHFGEFWFDMPIDAGLDPLSPAYRDAVLMHYRRLAGPEGHRPPESDPAAIGPDHARVVRPWPFDTGAGETVGQVLQTIGFIIATCRLRRGHRVLQLDAGAGTLALPLAQMGCAVTALDADPENVAVMRHRAERAGVALRALRAGASESAAALDGQSFDFVVFHAAFNRNDDHLALLRLIRARLLAPGGRLVLAGEPLLEAFPAPWGLNAGGDAIWSMRHGGGLSLVFRQSYLMHALSTCGYAARLTTYPQTGLGNVIVAVRVVQASA